MDVLVRRAKVVRASTDTAARLRRKRAGGNTGKNFTEGQVFFLSCYVISSIGISHAYWDGQGLRYRF
jgi:hypothetical protein